MDGKEGRGTLRQLLRLTGVRRVWLFVAALIAGGVLLGLRVGPLEALESPLRIPLWAMILGFAAAEVFVAHFQFRADAYSLSLSELPLIVGLFFASPLEVVVGRVVGSAIALAVHRRQSGIKLVFNVAHFGLEAVAAAYVFHAIVDRGDPLGPSGWAATVLVALVTDAIASLSVGVAIALSESRPAFKAARRVLIAGSIGVLVNVGLGLIGVVFLWHEPRMSWLLVAAVITLFLGYRGYGRVRTRQESLEVLYELTRMGHRQTDTDGLIASLLAYGRDMFRAETAEIVLLGVEDDAHARLVSSRDGRPLRTEQIPLEASDPLWGRAMSGSGGHLFARPVVDEHVASSLATRGLRDAMLAPLFGDNRVVGALLIGNRLGDLTSFDADDLKLFETLANHVSVSIDNAQLIQRLRVQAEENQHMALHDALTGLPNRTLFHSRASQHLRNAESLRTRAAIMILDLDRFKEINDALGHHTGDILLNQVAERLVASVGDAGVVSRLGGDEFAIALSSGHRGRDALDAALRIAGDVEMPYSIGDLTLDVGASIGVALYPDHGEQVDVLMQRADVAMYLAKEAGSAAEIYRADRDQYTPARLSLLGDLRRSIERGELVLHYQPKVEISTGRVVGVEALVRWDHPTRGMVFPDRFIPQAEHTGLIKPLTMWVIDRAVRDCRTWRRKGIDLGMAVNVSARLLRDLALPDEIKAILDRWHLPPSSLTLEITEGSLMADPVLALTVLRKVRELGVQLSIDDFGTGYSSLSQLKSMPVGEIKMDRSFVKGMLRSEDDAVIVRSTVDLGRNLGLRVVAEGVESEEILRELGRLGCDHAQGYFLTKPVPADRFLRWARRTDLRIPPVVAAEEAAPANVRMLRPAAAGGEPA